MIHQNCTLDAISPTLALDLDHLGPFRYESNGAREQRTSKFHRFH